MTVGIYCFLLYSSTSLFLSKYHLPLPYLSLFSSFFFFTGHQASPLCNYLSSFWCAQAQSIHSSRFWGTWTLSVHISSFWLCLVEEHPPMPSWPMGEILRCSLSTVTESLFCTPETNVILYVNYNLK